MIPNVGRRFLPIAILALGGFPAHSAPVTPDHAYFKPDTIRAGESFSIQFLDERLNACDSIPGWGLDFDSSLREHPFPYFYLLVAASSARHEAVQSGKAACPDSTRPAGPHFEGTWDPALKDILVPGYVGLARNSAVEYDLVVGRLHPPPGKYPVFYILDYDEAFLHYDCPGCAYSGWADSLTVLPSRQTGLSGAATAPLRIRAGFIGNALRLELPAGSWRGELMTPHGERVAAFEIGPHSKMPAEVQLRRRLAPGAYILTMRGREGAALRRILSAF